MVLLSGVTDSFKLVTTLYNPATNVCQILPKLSKFNKSAMSVMYDTFVFTVGRNHPSYCSVEMLDVSSQDLCWVPKNELLVGRQCSGVGIVNNCLYAVSYADIKLISCYKYLYNFIINARLAERIVV